MLRRNLEKRIAGAIILCVTVLLAMSPLSFAAEPHEDPDATEEVFSGISLLRYYSEALDFLLQMNPAEVESRLQKLPFASIPQSLKEATGILSPSVTSLSYLAAETDEDLKKARAFLEQSRFDESIKLAKQIYYNFSQANNKLEQIENAIEIVKAELKVPLAPRGSSLNQSYDEVLDRTDKIRNMPALYKDLIEDFLVTWEIEELLEPTTITLKIEPAVAFVGDNIHFEGVLTSGNKPLSGREVSMLVNSSRYLTVRTDAHGHYHGTLLGPYWYMPELSLQALYSPLDEDKGVYPASLSPVAKLKVLFYEASLEVAVEDKAYPGLETTVTGRFDYAQYPPPNERRTEIYVDNVLTSEFITQEAFTKEIKIDPELEAGEHIITVSSPAVGRYTPADTSVILNITRAIPVVDIIKPNVAVIPGSVKLEGKLYSEVSPLSEAVIEMGLGNSRAEPVSSQDGVFSTKIKVGMGPSIIGWQDLVMKVLPSEPWHAPLNHTSRILMVNAVNCGILIALILLLGIYLPARLRRRLGAYSTTTPRPTIITSPSEPAPAYSGKTIIHASTEEDNEASAEPRNKIFQWYRLTVRVIQGITKAVLKPQQTLREFAEESSKTLGPAGRFLIELTRIVERLLYSPYRPTEKDVERSRKLSDKIEEASKLRATTDALLGGEIVEAREYKLSDRAAGSPWRQPDTWLQLLLMLTVAYYACLLLFLLPLVVK